MAAESVWHRSKAESWQRETGSPFVCLAVNAFGNPKLNAAAVVSACRQPSISAIQPTTPLLCLSSDFQYRRSDGQPSPLVVLYRFRVGTEGILALGPYLHCLQYWVHIRTLFSIGSMFALSSVLGPYLHSHQCVCGYEASILPVSVGVSTCLLCSREPALISKVFSRNLSTRSSQLLSFPFAASVMRDVPACKDQRRPPYLVDRERTRDLLQTLSPIAMLQSDERMPYELLFTVQYACRREVFIP
jgi:hypothetical protein